MKWEATATAAEQTKRETLTASTATLKTEDTTVPATLSDWQVTSGNALQWWGPKMKTRRQTGDHNVFFSHPGKTYMCGDEGSWVGQFVMSPHPEREEDDGGQAYDGNQGVK